MLSLRLENMTKFIGWVLMIGIGVLITLLVLTIAGGAIPEASYMLNPNFLAGSTYNLIDTNGDIYFVNTEPQPAAVLSAVEWHTTPIRMGSFITAGVVFILGLLYLGGKITSRGMSEEMFP